MKILVCVKQILDPEISPRDFSIDQQRLEASPGNASFVTNIFCENALETALQFRDQHGGEITVLTIGPESAEESIRKALAMKADHGCRVDTQSLGRLGSDGVSVVIAAAVRKLGPFDLILLGREAGDWGEGRTAGLTAEHLQLPLVAFVDTIEPGPEGNLTFHRQTDFGGEVLRGQPPVVLSITNNDENVPRIPKTRDIMMAHRKEITNFTLDEIGLDAQMVQQANRATEVVELWIPERDHQCELIDGDTIDEKVAKFAERITSILRSI